MKSFVWQHAAIAILCTFVVHVPSPVYAQSNAADASATIPLQPRQPGGYLSNNLGTYLIIEGLLYEGNGKVESNSLVVDTVNGKRLEQPALILIKNVRLPGKERCVLKGYELGAMIGSPPALREAAEEQGEKYKEQSAAAWRWRPFFVVLLATKPKGLAIETK